MLPGICLPPSSKVLPSGCSSEYTTRSDLTPARFSSLRITRAKGHTDVEYISAALKCARSLLPVPMQLTILVTPSHLTASSILEDTVSMQSAQQSYSDKSSSLSLVKNILYSLTTASGLTEAILSAAARVLLIPSLTLVARSCLLKLLREIVSLSTSPIQPTPALAKNSATYPPTPPSPNTITLADLSKSAPSPISMRVRLSSKLIRILPMTDICRPYRGE